MTELALPALFGLVVWWLSTCAILYVNGLSPWTHRWSVSLATVLALLALWGVVELSTATTTAAAYVSFICALVIWGWHEMTFLLGWLTGPVRSPLPPRVRGLRRFVLATGSVIYHELALAVTLLAIAVATWGAPNRVALWTYAVLWVMRLSAKFNLYLGVRNFTLELIPPHMRYLSSYFGPKEKNALMPASVLGAFGVLLWLGSVAIAARASSFEATGTMLVATLLALALIEHLFLALPVKDKVLWQWAVNSAPANKAPPEDEPLRAVL